MTTTLNESLLPTSVLTEGHPRANGDGPLTINRSLETKGG